MPSWAEFQPYIVTGLALGGLYALSGVGLVVLYRATGVLNLAFGAVGAMGAFIAYSIIKAGNPGWVGWLTCILFAGAVTLAYGMLFGPALAGRGPLVQSIATLGLALVLFGAIDLAWPTSGGQSPSISFPTDSSGFTVGQLQVRRTPKQMCACVEHAHNQPRLKESATCPPGSSIQRIPPSSSSPST